MRSTAGALGLLAVLSLLVFANALPNGFAVDDEPLIVDNPLIRSLAGLPRLFATGYWAGTLGTHGADLYRPLVTASFALNHAAGDLAPFGYHLANVLLHAAASGALFVLGRQLGLSWSAALAAGALFAVHPLHTEAVTGVVGRAEALMTLGVLLALAWSLRASAAGPACRGLALASSGAFVLALLSKEQAVVLPLLLAFAHLSGAAGDPAGSGWGARARAAWRACRWPLAILVAYVALRSAILGAPSIGGPQGITFLNNPLAHAAWDVRLLTAVKVAGAYLGLFVWPVRLSVDYSYNAIPLVRSVLDPGVLLTALAWGALLAAGAYGARHRLHALTLGVGCAVLTFLPASNLLVPIGTIMAERLFYLPSAGLCLVAGAAWDGVRGQAARSARARLAGRVLLVALGVALVLLSGRTVLRNRDWHSTETVYRSALPVVPGSAKVHAVIAHYLLAAERPAESIEPFRTAIRIDPSYELAHLNLGVAYARLGRWAEAEASLRQGMALTERALGPEHPLVADTLGKLGVIAVLQGQAAGPPASEARYAQAEQLYRRALALIEKTLGPDHESLAEPLGNYATLLRQTGRATEAQALDARARAIRATASAAGRAR